MSTFNGVLAEFPDIQIDYFRKSGDRQPPLACFLTHVHTDHLQGLESFHAPFIYCSPITRELLLRLERFPHRLNYQEGIIETREVTYKHLNKLLRPVPLNTPTVIELTPLKSIRVTLIDANHCPGSVMFLIEGDGKTILYTGDIRAEKWWVDSLVRNPYLIPYTLGEKRLDNLYLDTTYLHGEGEPPENFSSKAEGIAELLKEIQSYPSDTVFHLRAWTFGYEEVWLALATALGTKVHVDSYQLSLYQSLGQANKCIDTAAYNGYRLGNDIVPGCLTSDGSDARIHLCVPRCDHANAENVVHIKPVLARRKDGVDIPDLGAGGGLGDVYFQHEIELPEQMTGTDFVDLCLRHMKKKNYSNKQKLIVRRRLHDDFGDKRNTICLGKYGLLLDDEKVSLKVLADLLVDKILLYDETMAEEDIAKLRNYRWRKLISFPYARHSSYFELCHFITVFKPKDIHACVVDDQDVSSGKALVQEFFGHYLTGHLGYTWGLRARRDLTEEVEKVFQADVQAQENYRKMGYPEPESDVRRFSCTYYGETYKDIRGLNDRWLLRAEVEHDFSSLPIAQDIDMAGNLAELSNLPRSDGVRTKREEIENAREYLQEQTDLPDLQIGPLPSTWIGGLDGACDSDAGAQKTGEQKTGDQMAGEQEADEHEADEHEADEHEADEHDASEHEASEHEANEREVNAQATENPASNRFGGMIWGNPQATNDFPPSLDDINGFPPMLGDIQAGNQYSPDLGFMDEARWPPNLGDIAVLRHNADGYAHVEAVPQTTFNDDYDVFDDPSLPDLALAPSLGSFDSGTLTQERLEEWDARLNQGGSSPRRRWTHRAEAFLATLAHERDEQDERDVHAARAAMTNSANDHDSADDIVVDPDFMERQ